MQHIETHRFGPLQFQETPISSSGMEYDTCKHVLESGEAREL